MNNTSTFAQVFNERLLVIPDYQRGYSWEERQWNDFLEDLEMLPSDRSTTRARSCCTRRMSSGADERNRDNRGGAFQVNRGRGQRKEAAVCRLSV